MPSQKELVAYILDKLHKILHEKCIDFCVDEKSHLLENGLDSFDFVSLILGIEEHFTINIDFSNVNVEDFIIVEKLAETIVQQSLCKST